MKSRKTPLLLLIPLVIIGAGAAWYFLIRETDEDKIRDTFQAFTDSVAEGDGAKACDQMSPDAKKALLEQAKGAAAFLGLSCERLMEVGLQQAGSDVARKAADAEIELDYVKVQGDHARAKAQGADEEMRFEKIGDKWLIESLE